MFHYCTINKFDTKKSEFNLVGLIGVNQNGAVAIVGESELERPFDALFETTLSFSFQKNVGDMKVLEKINPHEDPEKWIGELRRQMPAPYSGRRISTDIGELENLKILWQKDGGDPLSMSKLYQ